MNPDKLTAGVYVLNMVALVHFVSCSPKFAIKSPGKADIAITNITK